MKNKFLAILIISWILSSCTSHNEKEISKEVNKKNFLENYNNAKNNFNKNNFLLSDNNEKKLQIDDKCIGCGKCVRIAPKNFAMNFDTRKAYVISQENLQSERVQASIDICPVDSISIN